MNALASINVTNPTTSTPWQAGIVNTFQWSDVRWDETELNYTVGSPFRARIWASDPNIYYGSFIVQGINGSTGVPIPVEIPPGPFYFSFTYDTLDSNGHPTELTFTHRNFTLEPHPDVPPPPYQGPSVILRGPGPYASANQGHPDAAISMISEGRTISLAIITSAVALFILPLVL